MCERSCFLICGNGFLRIIIFKISSVTGAEFEGSIEMSALALFPAGFLPVRSKVSILNIIHVNKMLS